MGATCKCGRKLGRVGTLGGGARREWVPHANVVENYGGSAPSEAAPGAGGRTCKCGRTLGRVVPSEGAVDAATGGILWKTYAVPDAVHPCTVHDQTGASGCSYSGGAIWGWGGITYSAAQDALFVVTGNAFEGGSNIGAAFSEDAGTDAPHGARGDGR